MPVYEVFIDDKPRSIELIKTGESSFSVKTDDSSFSIELPTDMFDLKEEFSIKIGNRNYRVHLAKLNQEESFPVTVEEATFQAEVKTPARKQQSTLSGRISIPPARRGKASHRVAKGTVTAPMTGKILSIMVKKGDKVKAGQVLCILEAMKMENEITAPTGGAIKEIYVSEGSPVSESEALFTVG